MFKKNGLSGEEQEEADERQRPSAPVIYEVVRHEGEIELARPTSSLVWSGIAAGLSIGFSVVAEGILRAYLPDMPWRPLLENFGYSVGFLIVILAREQLFTENTITAVLPFMAEKTLKNLLAVLRLWLLVFAAMSLNPRKISSRVVQARVAAHHQGGNWHRFLRGILPRCPKKCGTNPR